MGVDYMVGPNMQDLLWEAFQLVYLRPLGIRLHHIQTYSKLEVLK